jgi:hypothetical protein
MHRLVWATGIALLVLVPAARVPSTSATSGTVTGFFYDGWPQVTFPGGLAAISGAGSVTGEMDRPTHLYVEAIGNDGDHWELSAEVPADGPPLGVGMYSAGDVDIIVNHAGEIGCSTVDHPGDLSISELSVNGAGVVTSLAADFHFKCTSTNPPPMLAEGQVRINASAPLTAIAIAPAHLPYPFTDHDFGVVPVGTSSGPWAVTVTNLGTTSIPVGGSVSGDGAFGLQPGGCSGSLGAGASCSLAVVFSPTAGGPTTGQLHVTTPSLDVAERLFTLAATGFQETTTTLTVDPLDEGPTPGAAAYHIDVTPLNAIPPNIAGTYEITRSCGTGIQSGVGGTSWLWTPAGPCTATATFHGYAGFGDSTSGPIAFEMPAKSKVLLDVTSGPGVEAFPHTVSASVSGANGVEPTAGTVTITDETTDTVLGSGPIVPGAMALEVQAVFGPGDHTLRADYTGDGAVLGTTATRPLSIFDDNYPPDGFLTVPEFTVESTLSVGTTAMDLPVDVVSNVALSNDGIHWATYPYAATVDWSLVDAATGGSNADGAHIVYARWRDQPGNWSPVQSKTVVLDRGLPTGTATIAGGAAYASSSTVQLATPASDALSGLASVAISNDGASWTTKPYATAVSWKLAPGNGARTVTVKWRDKAGNWSTPRIDTIVVDTLAPTSATPRLRLGAGTASVNGSVPVDVAWSAVDGTSGIRGHELSVSQDSGAWTVIGSSLSTPTATRTLAPGHAYRFRTRAVDNAGNVGPWATGPSLRLTQTSETADRITYTGAWITVADPASLGGHARRTTAAGATATFTFSGRSAAWVGRLGPGYGKVRIYVDGILASTFDLNRSTASARQIIFAAAWSTSGHHTIRLVNLGTTGRPAALVDAFYSLDGLAIGGTTTGR